MKNINLKLLISFVLLAWLSGCSNYVDNLDVSPNSPSNASPSSLLASAELALFSAYNGQNARVAGVWTQQHAGIDFQLVDVAQYDYYEQDVDNDFSTIYQTGVVNLNELIDKTKVSSPYYTGIAYTIKAMLYGLAADLWGDIPGSEAGYGQKGNLSPAYINQEQAYAYTQELLDKAIVELKKPFSANKIYPSSDDFVFSGDNSLWLASAYALKARYYNRLSKRSPQQSATDALAAISQIATPEVNMTALYSDLANENNPWYAFEFNRGGYMVLSSFLIDTLMEKKSDPRISAYALANPSDTIDGYSGTPLGSNSPNASSIGGLFASPSSPGALIMWYEVKFIEAEASLRLGDTTKALTALQDAVKASMEYCGVSGSAANTYIANQVKLGTNPLKSIMMEKYVAMFTQPEVWTDWRRTGYPELKPDPRASTFTEIPQRYPSSQNERLYNKKAVTQTDLTKKLWFAE